MVLQSSFCGELCRNSKLSAFQGTLGRILHENSDISIDCLSLRNRLRLSLLKMGKKEWNLWKHIKMQLVTLKTKKKRLIKHKTILSFVCKLMKNIVRYKLTSGLNKQRQTVRQRDGQWIWLYNGSVTRGFRRTEFLQHGPLLRPFLLLYCEF